MFDRTLAKLAAGACLAVSLTAHAEITPVVISGTITEGAGDYATSGTYLEDLGRNVGMVFPFDFAFGTLPEVSFPEFGTLLLHFEGEGVESHAFFYDSGLSGDFAVNYFDITVRDDVGGFDFIDLSFETIGGRGADVETAHVISLIGDNSCFNYGVLNPSCGLLSVSGYWQDKSLTTGEQLGYAHLDITGFDLFKKPYPEIPVPASAWLFGSALIGMAAIRRRR